jgi:hypothetical protein
LNSLRSLLVCSRSFVRLPPLWPASSSDSQPTNQPRRRLRLLPGGIKKQQHHQHHTHLQHCAQSREPEDCTAQRNQRNCILGSLRSEIHNVQSQCWSRWRHSKNKQVQFTSDCWQECTHQFVPAEGRQHSKLCTRSDRPHLGQARATHTRGRGPRAARTTTASVVRLTRRI